MASRPSTTLAGCLALLLGVAVQATAKSPPRGRIVWTELEGSDFSIRTTIYGPDGRALDRSKLPVKSPGETLTVDKRTLMFSPTGDELSLPGSLDPARPASELHFLHPAFDFTGRRIIWISGPSWGPKDLPPPKTKGQASTLSEVEGGTTVHYGEPKKQMTELSAQDGEAMDAFPISDPQARYVYFSRFFYGPGRVDVPGWYLMRKPREHFQDGTDKSAELVEDQSGKAVYGYQPYISETGEYMLYVKPDPENPGSDLWYIRMPPEENDQVLLWKGEGDMNFQVPDKDADMETLRKYQERQGRARITNPVITADSKLLVFSSDLSLDSWSQGGDTLPSWDLYALEVERKDDGSLTASNLQAIPQASEPDQDEMWPTISGDGFWVGYMTKPRDGGKSKIKLLQIRNENDAEGRLDVQDSPEDVEGSREGAMWPRWDQDEDPPSVLVRLNVSDGSPPLTLLIKDQDPDSSVKTDAVTMGIQIRNYNERIPDVPKPSPGDLPLIQLRGAEKSLHVPYETQGEVENSFFMLVAGDRDIGKWKGFKTRNPVPVQASKVDQAQLKALKSKDFKGLFLGENVRIEISVLARDNRWKRVPPDDKTKSLYSKDPLVEVTQIREEDYRSELESDLTRKEPYLDVITRRENMEDKLPGITWWLEEGPLNTTTPDQIKTSSQSQENAPYILFRAGNYPEKKGTPPDDPRNQDRFLRIVCRDLLSNVTDIRIPVYIKTHDFSVSTLRSGTQRSTGGP